MPVTLANETPAQSPARVAKELADRALALAAAGSWKESAEANRALLALGDAVKVEERIEAQNRLAKALWELGDLAGALRDLADDRLQALLELPAELRAGKQAGEVKREDLLALQWLGDIPRGDALRKALDDGRLADAGFADEHRVVLGAAAEDLHHALELACTTDHRVELLLACELREVATELVEDE